MTSKLVIISAVRNIPSLDEVSKISGTDLQMVQNPKRHVQSGYFEQMTHSVVVDADSLLVRARAFRRTVKGVK